MKNLVLLSIIISFFFLSGCCQSGLMMPSRTLRLTMENSPRSLDPALSTDTFSGIVIGLSYSTLLRFNAKGELTLDAAKFYSIKAEGRVYEFLLKENLKFSDGSSLTAEDVSYSLHRLASPKTNSPRVNLLEQLQGFEDYREGKADSISGIQVESSNKIRFVLKRPFSPFLSFFAMPQFAVLSKKYIEAGGDLQESTLGSGPYSLEKFRREQDLFLRANPHYRKRGNLEAIYIRILKEPLTRFAEFKNQNLHIIELAPAQQEMIHNTRSRLYSVNEYNLYYLGLNMKSERMQSLPLRKAIAQSIDRQTIVEKILKGQAVLATGPVPEGLPGYLKEPLFKYDAQKARETLAQSNYDSKPLRLLLSNSTQSVQLCTLFKNQMEKAGIKVELVIRDWNSFKVELLEGKYDLFYRNWVADFPDGDNFLFPLYHSSSTGLQGNYPGYSNSTFDALIENSRRISDPAKRKEMLENAAKIATQDFSRVPLWYKSKVFAVFPGVQNFEPYPMFYANKYLKVNLLTR